jgi:hypothetical protein
MCTLWEIAAVMPVRRAALRLSKLDSHPPASARDSNLLGHLTRIDFIS